MAERQQDLGNFPSEQPSSGDFFSNLSLPDIYGRYIFPPSTKLPINRDDYDLALNQGPEVSAKRQVVLDRLNIPSISAWGHERGEYYIVVGPTPPLRSWIPQQDERALLRSLASGLGEGREKQFVLEIDAENAIVSRILAAEGLGDITALDPSEDRLHSLPISSDVILQQGDVWSVLKTMGPRYPAELAGEAYKYLEALQRYQRGDSTADFIGLNRAGYLAKTAVKRMQQMVQQAVEPSPVDMVIKRGSEFDGLITAGIRDGIVPKAIVYVRNIPYLRPMPENWQDVYNQSDIKANKFTSYDPGENYRTVAAWRTFDHKYWDTHSYGFSGFSPHLQTEVLIQIRRDVKLGDLPQLGSPRYSFDDEVLQVLGKYQHAEGFQSGIESAREHLLTI